MFLLLCPHDYGYIHLQQKIKQHLASLHFDSGKGNIMYPRRYMFATQKLKNFNKGYTLY